MNRTAVFPGSFDPFTVGHEALVRRALPLFEKVIIAVGENAEKKTLFSIGL
jgi:pantetheine-phosphate adenylyltransferase